MIGTGTPLTERSNDLDLPVAICTYSEERWQCLVNTRRSVGGHGLAGEPSDIAEMLASGIRIGTKGLSGRDARGLERVGAKYANCLER